MGKPSVYPTGVTVYDKDRAYNGYTLFNSALGATLIDMNGRLVKTWKGIGEPLKPLPDGQLIGSAGQVPGPPGAGCKIALVQADWDGNVVWQYRDNKLVSKDDGTEMMAARKALFAFPMPGGDWIHLNAISTLGPNPHYDAGDMRFAPDNILCSSRQLNIVFIIEKSSKKIVWRLGPDYTATPGLAGIGQIIGQHHAHMIPKGLPGEGHILIFDNGSFGGYGTPNGCAPRGTDVMRRHFSRVVELDPVSLKVTWEYMKAFRNKDDVNEMNAQQFFSPYISSAQRLPNGNTLIDQGADGLFIEVTPEKEIVWEFVNPIRNPKMPPLMQFSVYRAYRVPYSWVPQVSPLPETSVIPPDITKYRVPGSFGLEDGQQQDTEVLLSLD